MSGQKRQGFILLTSVGLSALILVYALGIFPLKQQVVLDLREERVAIEQRLVHFERDLAKDKAKNQKT